MNKHAGYGDLRIVARGLIPAGFDPAALTPEGRGEVRQAIEAVLRLWDQQGARLTLALEQLDKAATEIEMLKAESKMLRARLVEKKE
jgi:hypothetical protein